MEKQLALKTFEAHPRCTNSAEEWTKWLKSFNDHIALIETKDGKLEDGEKLQILLNHVSSLIHRFVTDSASFQDSIDKLSGIYEKPECDILARQTLETRVQRPGETVGEYAQALHRLSERCEFKTVTAEQNRERFLKDSFISGLRSYDVRAQLLERDLSLKQAIEYAKLVEQSQRWDESTLHVAGPNSRFFGFDEGNQKRWSAVTSRTELRERSPSGKDCKKNSHHYWQNGLRKVTSQSSTSKKIKRQLLAEDEAKNDEKLHGAFLESQGIEVEEDEEVPDDPYTFKRAMQNKAGVYAPKPPPDRYTKFLMYDKKVLRFTGIWDNRSSEYGDVEEYHVLYYPEDDTMEILKRSKRREKEPTAPLLARIKVPKNWKKLRAAFPAESLENFYEHREETYLPQDLIVGNSIDVFGRTITLIDCDKATRQFYENYLRIKQPLPSIDREPTKEHSPYVAQEPAENLRDDILPEWHTFTPAQPKTDLVRYLDNMNKVLRYTAKLDAVRPEDEGRKFIIEYRLSDGCIKIIERKLRNTGFQGGKFLGYQLVPKPNTCPANPDYYSPVDLEIGGRVNVFGHRFIITGADLAVFTYMEQNTEQFKPEMICKLRDYLISEGRIKQIEEKEKEKIIDDKSANIGYGDKEIGDECKDKKDKSCTKRCTFADDHLAQD